MCQTSTIYSGLFKVRVGVRVTVRVRVRVKASATQFRSIFLSVLNSSRSIVVRARLISH